uniref:Uncharacterized protein n=1 Tax=Cacopsylla melanoneura TaxID=428564 RepID=A0A8D9E834_9HEMI
MERKQNKRVTKKNSTRMKRKRRTHFMTNTTSMETRPNTDTIPIEYTIMWKIWTRENIRKKLPNPNITRKRRKRNLVPNAKAPKVIKERREDSLISQRRNIMMKARRVKERKSTNFKQNTTSNN